MNVGQLKILQEVITLSVFVPFSVYYLKERLTLDYLWPACLLGAVFSCSAPGSPAPDPDWRDSVMDLTALPVHFHLDLPAWASAELQRLPEHLPDVEARTRPRCSVSPA